jgi:hypothetical protein
MRVGYDSIGFAKDHALHDAARRIVRINAR